MALLPRALRTRLENVADTLGLELFVAELVRFAARQGWDEVQPEDLAAFVLHSKLSYRTRAVLKAYRVDRSALPPLRKSDEKPSSVLVSAGANQIISDAVMLAAKAGRAAERLRLTDVLVALARSHLTAPLLHKIGLTRLRIVYFISHRVVLPDAIEVDLPWVDRDKPVWIRLQNDDFTPMDAVVHVLTSVFQLDDEKARSLMMKVHTKGQAFIGPFEYEIAHDLATRAMTMTRNAQHPLLITLARSQNQSFVARYWRGDVPLAQSLKRVALRGTLYFLALGSALLGYAFTHLSLQVAHVTLYAFCCAAAAFIAWQCTGLWRAASRSTQQWKSINARALVHSTIVLVLLGGAALLPSAAEGLRTLSNAIEVVANLPPFRIEVEGEDTLHVYGGIVRGAAQNLKQALDQHPRVRKIILESPGGFAAEGIRLQHLIRKRGLQTLVERDCFSACTLAFLGGTQRYIAVTGRLGFHRARSLLGAEFLITSQSQRAFLQSGVAPWFIERTQRTPSSSLWLPTADELIRAGVVTDEWEQ